MTTAIKRRRGTTTQHSTFTGLEGEITVDTTKDTAVIHDGATAGGFALLREDLSNNTNVVTLAGTQTLSNKTFSTNPTISSGTANGVAYLNGSKVLTTGSTLTFDGTTLTNASFQATATAAFRTNSSSGQYYHFDNASGNNFMGLFTTNQLGFAVAGSEQMRLTTTGLGIGTSSPSAKLHVSGANTAEIIEDTGTSYAYSNYKNTGSYMFVGQERSVGNALASGSLAYAGIIATQAAYPLQLGTNGTVRATLDSFGNLGLGVAPSAWRSTSRALQIGSTSSIQNYDNGGTIAVAIGNNYYWNSSDQPIYIQSKHATNYYQSSGQHVWLNAPSGTAGNAISFTQAMTLDASGNLGLGTTSPVGDSGWTNFTLKGTNGGEFWFQDSTGTGTYTSSQGYIGTSSTDFKIIAFGASRSLSLGTNNTERMRIDSSGNLLLGGTSTPGAKVMYIANATTVPASNPSGGGVLYVEGGALKYRGSSGTVTTIAAA